MLVLAVAVVALVAVIVVRRQTRPLNALASALQRYAQTGTAERIAVPESPRVATAVKAFNGMVDEQLRVRRELERQRRVLEDEIDRNTVMLLRYQLALDAGQLGVWDWDLTEDTIAWSENIEELHGVAAGDFGDGHERFLSRVHPDDRSTYTARLRSALAGDQDFDLEYRIVAPDGSVRWMRSAGEVYHGPDHVPVRMVGVLMDISRRREAEEAAAESERRYRTLVEQVPSVTYTVAATLEAPALFVSPQIEDLVGWRPDEFLADSRLWERNLHPDDRDAMLSRSRACREQGDAFATEYRVIAKDGHVVWVRDEATLITDDHGRPRYLQGIIVDIRERKEAERALQAQAGRAAALGELGHRALAGADLDVLFETAVKMVADALSPDICGVMELLPDGCTLALRANYGLPAKEHHARFDLEEGTDLAWALQSSDAVLTRDVGADTRFTFPPLPRTAGMRSGIVVRVEGRTRSWGLLAAHASAAHAFSEEDATFLQSLAHVLASAIGRREAEEQLLQAQKMDAVGRLAGGIAHDFNNLMTAVLGYAELLGVTVGGDEPARSQLDEITLAGQRATSLVDQLLSFSRVAMSRPVVVTANDVVASMQGMLSRLLDERIELVTELDPELDAVYCDPNRLEQIVLNLAVNARDAMPDGGHLTIATANVDLGDDPRPDAHAGPHVRLSVTDTGVGMDSVTVAQAFEPFFTTKPHGKGTGLGLATVYGIVTAADGRVQIDSEPGHGTTVIVDLPPSPAAAVQSTTSVEAPAPAPAQPSGRERVLLVEDQAAVRTLVREVLSRHGYEVYEAADGIDALELLATGAVVPDMLVTDVVMPGLGGRELAERLHDEHPTVPVLYMSGYSDRPQPPSGTTSAFLAKPFSVGALLQKVRELLDA